MSVLSDLEIIEGLRMGHVVCRPLRPENIRGASIDLSIGEWFWRCDARPEGVFNPYDRAEIERYFAGPFRMKPYRDVYDKIGGEDWPPPAGDSDKYPRRHFSMPSPFKGVPEDWPVLVLRPRERVLAHTHEFFGIHPPGTSKIHARSSTGRIGETVCKCAGLGDPGYVNRWTVELENSNDEAIVIPLGERLAQGQLSMTGPVREHYGTEKLYESKYQTDDDIERIIANWRPGDMLPRCWKDTRQALLPTGRDEYERALDGLTASVA